MRPHATIREVGLRDGLQLVKSFLATERKIAWCREEVAAGLAEAEATSFVPPSVVPQFADAAEVFVLLAGFSAVGLAVSYDPRGPIGRGLYVASALA